MKGSKRKLDEAAKYEEYAYKNNIHESELVEFYDILKNICNNVDVANKICGAMDDIATGELPTDLVMAAYTANVFAHRIADYGIDEEYEADTYYDVKSKLLEYIFQHNIWGNGKYGSYGIGFDDYENAVAYFDVPGHGQVSFHLPNTNYYGVRDYEFGWTRKVNLVFPSYSNINNFHDLQMALWGTEIDMFSGVEIEIPEEPIDEEIKDTVEDKNQEIEMDDEYYNYDDDYDDYDYDNDDYDDYDYDDDDYDDEDIEPRKYIIGSIDLSDYTEDQEININYIIGENLIPMNSLYYLKNECYPNIYNMTIQNGQVVKIRQLSRDETVNILKDDISQHHDALYSYRCRIEDIKFAVDLGIVNYDAIAERVNNDDFECRYKDEIIDWIKNERSKERVLNETYEIS